MQNKANFRRPLMSVTSAITSTYEEKPPRRPPKNKANSNPISNPATHRLYRRLPSEYSARAAGLRIFAFCILLFDFFSPLQARAHKTTPFMQNKANFRRGVMAVTSVLTSTYEEKPPPEAPKNKANSKPIAKKPKINLRNPGQYT